MTLEEENARLREALKAAVNLAKNEAMLANPRAYGLDPGGLPKSSGDVISGQCDLAVYTTAHSIEVRIREIAESVGVDT